MTLIWRANLSGSEVTEVYASGACLVNPQFARYGDVDTAIITLKFANGAIGVIDNCRQAPYGYDQRVEVHCEKGCVQDKNSLENGAFISTGAGVGVCKAHLVFPGKIQRCLCGRGKSFCGRRAEG